MGRGRRAAVSEEDASKLLHQLSMRPQGSGAKRGSETEGLRAIARGWEMEGRSGRAELSTDVEKLRFSFSVTAVSQLQEWLKMWFRVSSEVT